MKYNEIFRHSKFHITLLLVLLSLLSMVVYWEFLTLDRLLLYKDIGSDSINELYPRYFHLADYLRTEGWPAWAFSQGMGQNIFPNSIGDLSDLAIILMGTENFAYGLAYREVFKILLAGILFYLYLRTLSMLPLTAVMGGLLFAFSGFMILSGTWWYTYTMDVVYFTFLLYAFEQYLRNRVWVYFPIAMALVVTGTSFNVYLHSLFFLPYSLFRFYTCYGWQPKILLLFLLKLIGLAVVGLGISAVFLVADLQEMINSPRGSGDISIFASLMNKSPLAFGGFEHNITAVMRLFSSDLLGTGSAFRGWDNYYEAPMFYCGLLSLLLAPQVFVQLDRKQKLAFTLFGLFFLIPAIFPFFRYLFWAFAGDYYRFYSVFVAFVFLFFSLHALNFIFKTGKVHIRLLIVTLLMLLLMLFSPYLLNEGVVGKVIEARILLMISSLLLVYAALVIALRLDRFRFAVQCCLLLVVCLELTSFSWLSVNDRPVLTVTEHESKAGYNDYSNEAVAYIKQMDPGFYRVEKIYSSGPAEHRSINDAKVQGYFGTSSYHSFNQLNYVRFLDVLGIIDGKNDASTRWVSGLINDLILTSFSSVKYVLVKQADDVPTLEKRRGYRVIHEAGDVKVMINPSHLPFGFTYDSYMDEEDFMPLTQPLKRIALMKAVITGEQVDTQKMSQFTYFDKLRLKPDYALDAYLGDLRQRGSTVLNISHFDNNTIEGEIELEKPKILFFTLPFDPGWTATVNGKPVELFQMNIGFSGLLLPAGEHAIVLRYHLPHFKSSLIISIVSLMGFLFFVWRAREDSNL